jgi:hypothetical protein
LPLAIHQRNQGDRFVQNGGSQFSDAIEMLIGRLVEQQHPLQRSQAIFFVGRERTIGKRCHLRIVRSGPAPAEVALVTSCSPL